MTKLRTGQVFWGNIPMRAPRRFGAQTKVKGKKRTLSALRAPKSTILIGLRGLRPWGGNRKDEFSNAYW